MSNFLILVKINLYETFSINKRKKSKLLNGKETAMGIVIAIAILSVAFNLYMASRAMGEVLLQIGQLPVLLSMGLNMAFMLVLVFCIYKMPGVLFAFRDFDLLMSLPIKPGTVLASKLFANYVGDLGASLLVALPSFIVYGVLSGAGVPYYIIMLLLLLFVPMVPMVVGAVLAFILAKLSTKLRMKNFVMIVGMIVMLLAVFAWSFGMSYLATAQGAAAAGGVFSQINAVNLTAGYFIDALQNYNILSLLLFAVISLGLFGLLILILGKTFKNLNASMRETVARKKYKAKSVKVNSPVGALYRKELRGFFGSYIYAMNTGVGMVLMTILSVACLIGGSNSEPVMIIRQTLGAGMDLVVLGMICSFMIATTNTCAPSISIERNRIWILRSMPVHPKDVFKGKILLNLTIAVPAMVVNCILISIALAISFMGGVALVAYSVAFSLFIAQMGLFVNLRFPKLDYQNEIVAVKQSMSVLVSLFAGFAFGILPYILCLSLAISPILFIFGDSVLFLILAALLWKNNSTKGAEIFGKL